MKDSAYEGGQGRRTYVNLRYQPLDKHRHPSPVTYRCERFGVASRRDDVCDGRNSRRLIRSVQHAFGLFWTGCSIHAISVAIVLTRVVRSVKRR
jgi:hypothetical protein